MATLLLMRHAKSDWHGDEIDRDRPLSPRGRRAARTMGRFLASTGDAPDLVITSPAARATETTALLIAAGHFGCPTTTVEALYTDGIDGLVNELRAQMPSTGVLLAVGHEPTSSDAVALFTGGGRVRMTTASVARIDFDDAAWADVGPGAGLLTWLVTPRIVT